MYFGVIFRVSVVALLLCLCGPSVRADYPLPPRTTGNIFVSSYGTDEVACHDSSYRFVLSFSHADLDGPRGLVFNRDLDLYVASQLSDRVLVFNQHGSYFRQFTAEGLSEPTGMAISPSGMLYVSSFATDEIFVFRDEVHVDTFTTDGLNGPNCIVFSSTGDIYVSSGPDSRVYHFSPDHEFVRAFTGGGLLSAMGAAIYDDEIFVTGGGSNTVNVFDLEGNLQRTLTDELIDGPQGVAFDDQGRFSVSSFFTGKVAVYDRQGSRLAVFQEAGLSVARSVAYLPLSTTPTFIRGDFDSDAFLDIVDGMALLMNLFVFEWPGACADAGDVDDSGLLEIGDVIALFTHLFLGGPAPEPPYPTPGLDLTDDSLGC